MTNDQEEPDTSVFFAIELLDDGSLKVHPLETPWKQGKRIATVSEISQISMRVSEELNRHLIVEQVTDRVTDSVSFLLNPSSPSFSQKLVEALNERGINWEKEAE